MNWRLSAKELAHALRRSRGYIAAMKRRGFRMPGGTCTLEEALEWLDANPKPCAGGKKVQPLGNAEHH